MKVIIFGIIGIGVVLLAGDQIEQALSALLFAGIVPGTSVQLPWYVPILLAPILLYSLYQTLMSLFTKNLPRKTAISKTETKRPKNKLFVQIMTQLKRHFSYKNRQRFLNKLKKLLRRWHNTLKPQLQLLQQKLVAFARRLHRGTLQLLHKR